MPDFHLLHDNKAYLVSENGQGGAPFQPQLSLPLIFRHSRSYHRRRRIGFDLGLDLGLAGLPPIVRRRLLLLLQLLLVEATTPHSPLSLPWGSWPWP